MQRYFQSVIFMLLKWKDFEANDDSTLWNQLRKLKVHDRLKVFMWRFMTNSPLTRLVLDGKFGGGDKECAVCGAEEESVFHLFTE